MAVWRASGAGGTFIHHATEPPGRLPGPLYQSVLEDGQGVSVSVWAQTARRIGGPSANFR